MGGTILMVHGMFCGPWVWENYVPFFEERGWRPVTTTLRHHGLRPGVGPPAALGTTSVLDYVADLEREIDAMDEVPVVMGHSMGGLLAQMLAARGRARAAVLLTPAAPRGVLALAPSVILSFRDVLTTWGFWKKSFRPTYRSAEYAFLEGFPPEERRGIWERLGYESGRAIFEIGLWPFDGSRATQVDPSSVRCPLFVVAGGRDRATPPGVVKKVARRYGDRATFREFPAMAHWVLAEPGWEEVAGAAASWLEGVLGD